MWQGGAGRVGAGLNRPHSARADAMPKKRLTRHNRQLRGINDNERNAGEQKYFFWFSDPPNPREGWTPMGAISSGHRDSIHPRHRLTPPKKPVRRVLSVCKVYSILTMFEMYYDFGVIPIKCGCISW